MPLCSAGHPTAGQRQRRGFPRPHTIDVLWMVSRSQPVPQEKHDTSNVQVEAASHLFPPDTCRRTPSGCAMLCLAHLTALRCPTTSFIALRCSTTSHQSLSVCLCLSHSHAGPAPPPCATLHFVRLPVLCSVTVLRSCHLYPSTVSVTHPCTQGPHRCALPWSWASLLATRSDPRVSADACHAHTQALHCCTMPCPAPSRSWSW